MNASRRNSKKCKFFLPDPWTFSESAYPFDLNKFLDLPRYYAKNYLSPSKRRLVRGLLKNLSFYSSKNLLNAFIKELLGTIYTVLFYGINDNILFCLFDLYSTLAFIEYKKLYNPQLSLIFINSLAHNQHSHWEKDKINKNMKFCLSTTDKILGLLFNTLQKDEALLVINALGQRNVDGDGFCIYRQISPSNFLKFFNLSFNRIEQGMTNDGHVFFDSKYDLIKAYTSLKEARINEDLIFHVEKEESKPFKLFYQCDYHKRITPKTIFNMRGKDILFSSHFKLLGVRERTGSHIPIGDILFKGIEFPETLNNFQIKDHILSYFIPEYECNN